MAVLGYLPKLKRGLGLAFGVHFLHDFPKIFPYLLLYEWTKFQCHTFFSFSRYQTKCVLSSYLGIDDVIRFKIYPRTTSKAMTDSEKNRGRRKYKNLNISRTKRAF